MSLLTNTGIFLGAYLAAGRVGLVAACMLTGMNGWQTMGMAILVDLFQTPVYGFLLEAMDRRTNGPTRIRRWIERRTVKLQEWMASGKLVRHFRLSRSMMIVAVSFLPFRGFGILSACILAFLMGYGRVRATLLIMAGSVVGTIILVVLFTYPVKVFQDY